MSPPAGKPGNEGAARCRVVAAIGLIALAALLTIRWSIQTWGQVARGDEVTHFLARCQRLGASLPATGRIGYIVRPQDVVLRKPIRRARLTLLQYALAPRVVEEFSDQELVIFDSDDPTAVPATAERGDWRLVADLDDGLKLFRTPERK
jgi:hypothetical protein